MLTISFEETKRSPLSIFGTSNFDVNDVTPRMTIGNVTVSPSPLNYCRIADGKCLNEPLPISIVIAGPGISRGYTEEHFVPDISYEEFVKAKKEACGGDLDLVPIQRVNRAARQNNDIRAQVA